MLSIVNHRLVGPNVSFRMAQASGGRLVKPTAVTAHDTAGSLRKFSSVEWFESPECGTSAHVVIELDGTITQMVPFDTIAYHAGRSTWKGQPECNKRMVGIEIMSPGMMIKRGDEALLIYKVSNAQGKIVEKVVERFPLSKCVEVNTEAHGHGWALPYTQPQIDAFTQICKALIIAYPSIAEIVTHWLISPGRKVDTTPAFPLDDIRQAVFGGGLLAKAEPSMSHTTTTGITGTVVSPPVTQVTPPMPVIEAVPVAVAAPPVVVPAAGPATPAEAHAQAHKALVETNFFYNLHRSILKKLGFSAGVAGGGTLLGSVFDDPIQTGWTIWEFAQAHPMPLSGAALVLVMAYELWHYVLRERIIGQKEAQP